MVHELLSAPHMGLALGGAHSGGVRVGRASAGRAASAERSVASATVDDSNPFLETINQTKIGLQEPGIDDLMSCSTILRGSREKYKQ